MQLPFRLFWIGVFSCGLGCFSQPCSADIKDDFIQAVQKYCDRSFDEAKSLATTGRTGNIVKYALCSSQDVLISDCLIPCEDRSSQIGR